MKTIFIMISCVVGAAAMLCSQPAAGHGWYPKECCSDRDCLQADQMTIDERGDRIVIVGNRRIWVSKYVNPRPSPDRHIHICVREMNGDLDGALLPMTLCLFIPAVS